jgi:3-polyprenyl-4-hydroxybenzoate decarboxylase
MGEWLLSRRDRLIVARREVPLQFGHLKRLQMIDAPKGLEDSAQG